MLNDRVLFDPEERLEVELPAKDYVLLRERDVHAVAVSSTEEGQPGPVPLRPPPASRRAPRLAGPREEQTHEPRTNLWDEKEEGSPLSQGAFSIQCAARDSNPEPSD
jgi:hypothetical protein